jgi:hypothetical protein
MTALRALIHELIGLFVDDGALALAIGGVVALAGLVAWLGSAAPWLSGGILLFGCLAALVVNVLTAKPR